MHARDHEKLRKLAKEIRADGVRAHRAGHPFEAMGLFRRSRELDEILDEAFGVGPCHRCGDPDNASRLCDDCRSELGAAGFGADDLRFLATLDSDEVARGFVRTASPSELDRTGDAVEDARRLFFSRFTVRGEAVAR